MILATATGLEPALQPPSVLRSKGAGWIDRCLTSIKRGDERDMLNPELPPNLEKAFTSSDDRIFADFEVCPIDADRPGEMQAACIESAKRIFVQKVTLPSR